YLNMDSILSAAFYTGADAIHPGYGLLSENARFAELCEKCNFTFIGPPAEAIRNMGDKEKAKRVMKAAGVPVVPGCDVVENAAEAKREAERIGYPLLCKSRSGGGGRGIRLVKNENELEKAFRAASIEAKAAFGDGGIYLEKYIEPAKHIEVQLLCDNYGNAVCLGERECSMQRRSQKLIEESPSPSVNGEIRQRLIDVSLKAAAAIGYRNAGTIEFILDRDGNFYFMEMNTRLQVEHPVTEMVTGIDIVKWQLRIAADVRLPFRQDDIRLSGHAIECRINAEDPYRNFRPGCGTITALHIPSGPWVRFDSAVYQGYSIPPYYDSMIGKLIVHAADREEAIRKMQASLSELIIEGVDSNIDFHMELLDSPAFVDGSYSTGFLTEFLNGRLAAKGN
ncbi:MAG: ATP-grasp domain-containing protein, partial [Clostridiales bacterium]|nr:ATP-grasp domain-containing protein [Clostridiales bacterium]